MGAGNIEQRIFDTFPPFPVSVPLNYIRATLPYYTHDTIRFALVRLTRDGVVQRVSRLVYRLAPGATRPLDARGGARG